MKHTVIALAIATLMAGNAHAAKTPESPLTAFPSLTADDPGISKTPVDPASKNPKSASAAQAAKPKAATPTAAPKPVAAAAPAKAAAVAAVLTVKPAPVVVAPQPVSTIADAQMSNQVVAMASLPSQVRPYVLSPSETAYLTKEAELKRRVRLLELEAKVADLQRKIEGPENRIADSVTAKPAQASVLDIPPPQPFRLISVWGEASNLHADLLMNGVRVPVAKGHQLPDGWTVDSIVADAVHLRRGRQAMSLKIGG